MSDNNPSDWQVPGILVLILQSPATQSFLRSVSSSFDETHEADSFSYVLSHEADSFSYALSSELYCEASDEKACALSSERGGEESEGRGLKQA